MKGWHWGANQSQVGPPYEANVTYILGAMWLETYSGLLHLATQAHYKIQNVHQHAGKENGDRGCSQEGRPNDQSSILCSHRP